QQRPLDHLLAGSARAQVFLDGGGRGNGNRIQTSASQALGRKRELLSEGFVESVDRAIAPHERHGLAEKICCLQKIFQRPTPLPTAPLEHPKTWRTKGLTCGKLLARAASTRSRISIPTGRMATLDIQSEA